MSQPARGADSSMATGQPPLAWRLRTLATSDLLSRLMLLVLKEDGRPLTLDGFVRGPLCEYAATLPARHSWKPVPSQGPSGTERPIALFGLDIPESCLWEPEHPFLYEGHWAVAGHAPVPIRLGVRTLAVHGAAIQLNGRPYPFRGVALPADKPPDADLLRHLHKIGVNLLFPAEFQPGLAWSADELGPFLAVELPDAEEEALATLAEAGPRHPSIGIWIVDSSSDPARIGRLRAADRMTLFGCHCDALGPIPAGLASSGLDLVILSGSEEAIRAAGATGAGNLPLPWLGLVVPAEDFALTAEGWEETAARLDRAVGELPGSLGWVVRVPGGRS